MLMKEMRRKRLVRTDDLVFGIIAVFLIGMIIGNLTVPQKTNTEIIYRTPLAEHVVEMGMPAVDENGNGVVAKLETNVRPGTGMVLVNINDVLAQYDTQYSGRVAAKVASDFTKLDMSRTDVIYNIKVNATLIEGPSAGSAMAVSIIAALLNKTPDKNVMVTGTIEEDGKIGRVGAIYEKAKAAKDVNVTTFVVPAGQSNQSVVTKDKKCQTMDSVLYCHIKYVSQPVSIGEKLNMTVAEAENIEQALKYFGIA